MPHVITVVKLVVDTMDVAWTREISYNITGPRRDRIPLRSPLSVSAADGVVGLSFNFVTASGPYSVEGVELPAVQLSSVPGSSSSRYGEDLALVILDDANGGATLAVTSSETSGPDARAGGGSMLENGVYAMVGQLNVTEFSEPQDSFSAGVPTGQIAAFFPFLSPSSPVSEPKPSPSPYPELEPEC